MMKKKQKEKKKVYGKVTSKCLGIGEKKVDEKLF